MHTGRTNVAKKYMIKVFVDANVFLEVLLRRTEHAGAAALLKAGEEHQFRLFTSASIIGFLAYWLAKEMSVAKTKTLLLQLTQFITVLELSHEQVVHALQSDFKDIEDSLQYFTALEHRMDFIATFNKKDFKTAKGAIRIAAPQEILNSTG